MLTSIVETTELLRKRELSPVELTKNCLAQIEKLNPTLNAFITVTAESALTQARTAEAEILRGHWRGPLHGIPLALKDLIDTAGIRTTAASALFKDRVPTDDAEVVRRLKEAGAVLLGKQNLHEFAYGGSSMISYYGEVHNPWDPARIAGGSSGGSAASVAAGLGYGAIGTDTAGSVREPAALCGIVGLKPTYGRVSVHGAIPLSLSLDHIGPIARTVSDAAVMLQVIAGHDAKDAHSADVPVSDYVAGLRDGVKQLRIGIPMKIFLRRPRPGDRIRRRTGDRRIKNPRLQICPRSRLMYPLTAPCKLRSRMPTMRSLPRGVPNCTNQKRCAASERAKISVPKRLSSGAVS